VKSGKDQRPRFAGVWLVNGRILSSESPVSMKRPGRNNDRTIDAMTGYGDLVLGTAPLSLRYFAHAGLFFSSIDQPAAFSVPQKRAIPLPTQIMDPAE
jgi:hypothetical protein